MSTFLLPLEMPRTEAALRDARDGSPEARWIAAMALGTERGERRADAVQALLEMLKDTCDEVRAQALEGVAEQKHAGAEISESVAEGMLADPAACVRCAAVESASVLLADPVGAITPLLEDEDPSVRAASATALGELKAVGAVESLAGLLEDPDLYTAGRAAMALAALDDPRGEQMLLALLDGDAHSACEAAMALGELGRATSVPALRKTAKGRFCPVTLKAASAAAMARCSAAEGKAILVAMLESGSHIKRMTALSAIARLPVSGVESAVGALLEGKQPVQVSSAIETLIAIGQVDAQAALDELKKRSGKISAEFEDELNEALVSLGHVG